MIKSEAPVKRKLHELVFKASDLGKDRMMWLGYVGCINQDKCIPVRTEFQSVHGRDQARSGMKNSGSGLFSKFLIRSSYHQFEVANHVPKSVLGSVRLRVVAVIPQVEKHYLERIREILPKRKIRIRSLAITMQNEESRSDTFSVQPDANHRTIV